MKTKSSSISSNQGFTLIELLVVIAIISLLSTTVMASLSSARSKARDIKRQEDLRSVRIALEIFYDSNSRYPSGTDGNCSHLTSFLSGGCLQVLVTNGLISVLPRDPNSGSQYYYDNWCSIPAGSSNQRFRMWADGESNHNGLAQNWWLDSTIGQTTCPDPS